MTGDEPDVRDGKDLRRLALALKVPIITTVAGAVATANALKGLREKPLQHVRPCLSVTMTLPGTCIPVLMNTPKSSLHWSCDCCSTTHGSHHGRADTAVLSLHTQIPLQGYFPDYVDAQAALAEEVEAPRSPPPLAPAS